MCGIWKKKGPEMSLEQIKKLIEDPLFDNIKYCGLGGGEPTLREDLPDIANLIISRCKKLKNIGFSTNGLIPELSFRQSEAIADLCKNKNIDFGVTVSLDGLGEIHDKVRGVEGAFKKASRTLESLIELKKHKKLGVGTNCVISKYNAEGLPALYSWVKDHEISNDFAIARVQSRFSNEKYDIFLTKSQIPGVKKFIDFLEKKNPFSFHYYTLNRVLAKKKRQLTCPLAIEGVRIDPNGDMYYCFNSNPIGNVFQRDASSIYYDPKNIKYRRFLERKICPECTQDCFESVSFHKSLDVAIPFFLLSFFKHKILRK
jgi:MoaA/NifB/PqqE/SkfB family radical SAM enzyme